MLDELLKRARLRMVYLRLVSRLALAGVCFCAALVALLILGTQILNWWVPVLLGSGACALGLFWVFIQVPSTAQVARILDLQCSLSDTLATAFHFRDATDQIAQAQRRQAEALANSVRVTAALPFAMPSSLYVLAGLGIAASLLFVIRYGVDHNLSLSAPIAGLNLDPLGLVARAGVKASEKRDAAIKASRKDLLSRLGTSTPDNPNPPDVDALPGTALASGPHTGKDSSPAALSDRKYESKLEGASDQPAESADGMTPKPVGEQSPSTQDGAPQSAQGGGKLSGSQTSGLLSKLREAVSSLMSKMKPEGNPPNNPPGGQQANGKQPSGQPNGRKGEQDAKGNAAQQEGNESTADSEQTAPGQGAGKSNDQNASAKPGSGVGHQDGAKELKDAEQLAAMGKLSEIIGKRSANVTGEMTIESQSGPQQLKTGYSHSNAKHGEAGGDVTRDEVPVALQSYVQRYFEQVRKHPAKTARAGQAETHP